MSFNVVDAMNYLKKGIDLVRVYKLQQAPSQGSE